MKKKRKKKKKEFENTWKYPLKILYFRSNISFIEGAAAEPIASFKPGVSTAQNPDRGIQAYT